MSAQSPLKSPRVTSTKSSSFLGARDLALVAAFAALIAVLGLPGTLYAFGGPVPITLQTLGVMLSGAILGWKRGALAVIVFLVLVAVGLPLLAGGRGGLAVFAGPSVGYLIGWIFGAAVIGLLVQARLPRYSIWWTGIANVVGGIGVVYLIGVPVLVLKLGTGIAALASAAWFLPGDVVKVIIATVVAAGVHRAYPQMLSPLRNRQP
jgi:biotin transport system substrate-specific component